ncbi:glycosyl hydrolase family 18 protein [Clostridium formicaceticum]|uniref:Spore germination protein YaaH n=1 Tax=Clostridium formicaceticum TaxID=1497 RepID=A0AAC9RN13_9CLOT|nr:glycosyl hydrolase family 18 protein [Clostridium formicaceticum]AOY78038.1 hypothetical protein BJL90_20525 [Clostridium formicaceticum]ARE88674.1 Spore germination protein YaaH [Clostridium formicaceticum]
MCQLKKVISLVLISVLIFSNAAFANENTVEVFNDVPEDHWASKAIHDLRLLEITNGIGDNQFGMGLTISRGEFITFLAKLMKWDLISPEKGNFVDNMDTTKWYYAPIETALQQGVILKDTDKFRAEEPITREEIAVMIVRALGYDSLANQLAYLGSPFDDVSKNTGYITIARDFQIIAGAGNNLFKPYDTARREEAAVMMMKMYERLNKPISELHAFYAIRSANQMDMLHSLDSVGFGWSRLEYDAETNQVLLNTTRDNDNDFGIPAGFSQPLNLAKEKNISAQLMVFAENDTVLNTDTESNVPLVQYIVTKPEVRKQVIDAIVKQINATTVGDLTVSFNGVVIDFENMKGDLLKKSFNIFLAELRQELDKNNKLLYVAVHPARPSGQAYYDGYDFKAIGEIADKVILMAHDYYARQLTDDEMQRGYTLTPLSPIGEIYYALKSITDKNTGVQDLNKIWVQFSLDAVQWKLKEGKVINKYPYHPSYEAIQQRLITDEVTINYSQQNQNPYATFFDSKDETDNILWYEDSRSIQAKIDLAKMFGIEGISLWRLGNIPNYEEYGSKKIYLDVWQQILNKTKK